MNNLINRIRGVDYSVANSIITKLCGIINFFTSEGEKEDFINLHNGDSSIACEDKVSYGDWQTPAMLAERICDLHLSKFGEPNIVIEPTCGLGAFVLSALKKFKNLSEIHAIEINRQYTIELKLKILLNALNSPSEKYPDIYIYNANFFEFDLKPIIDKTKFMGWNLAVIGNPPWVTNSRQGVTNSTNVPFKSNINGLKGIDAITGKSNFDISEYITLHILKLSQKNHGGISFLLKNSVIRNILEKQHTENLQIANIEQRLIDASREFDVSVDASCLFAQFDCTPSFICKILNFYSSSYIREYGWVGDSFVSDTAQYNNVSKYDNKSSYVWRSGIKHDCASILELTYTGNTYKNDLGEIVNIETDLIFPLLKSSDINAYQEKKFRKYIIVPQRKVGEDTSQLKYTHPLTYLYLSEHAAAFASRKSSIYRGKDRFSIFGIGDYSFKPYKIVVSSLYKSTKFILVSHIDGKSIMVDDTCYQLDFDSLEEAQCVLEALNSTEIRSLLQSLVFNDAKRVITKSILMRLDLFRYCLDKGLLSKQLKPSPYHQLFLFDKSTISSMKANIQ